MRKHPVLSRFFALRFEPLEPRRVLDGGLLITELMAINNDTLDDENGESTDWIEIHNPTDDPVNLDGWYLTDRPDELTGWRFPDVVVAPGEFLIVHASGKDRVDAASNLHTNFKLSGDGEYLALVQADGQTIRHQFAPQFPRQVADVSYGLAIDLTSAVYFTTPTPGTENADGVIGLVAGPRMNVEHGFFDAPFDVEIVSDTPDAEIRYTLNGSPPTAGSGIVYDGPIHVDTTTTLRAAAFKPQWHNSEIVTSTYIFLEHVLEQPSNPEGFPAEWHLEDGEIRPGQYGVNRQVVNFHRDTILDDLKSIPSLSLVLDVDEMFGTGCRQRTPNQPCGAFNSGGSNIDSPTSVELIMPDGSAGFQIDAGLRLQGGSSRLPGVGKHSLRLKFTAEFGPTKLEYPFFDDSPVDTFDTIILRANVQDGWGGGSARDRQLIKDEYTRRSQLAMGQPSAHGTWTHLYINGLYWGMYNLVERPNGPFAAAHMGGDKDDWDTLNGGRLREGNLDAWNAMLALTPRGGPDVRNFTEEIVNANYQAIQEYLDVPGYIDYVLMGTYMGTEDWLPNNYYAARRSRDGDNPVDPNDPASKFRFFHWDQEKGLLGVDKFKNLPGFASPIGRIFQLLRKSDEFVELQSQRLYTHFFNDGALSPEVAAARYQGLVDEVSDAIKGEAIRWGQAPSNLPDWQAHADFLINTLIPGRREGILDQYRRFGLYPKTDAPVLSQRGGQILSTQPLTMTATEGVIYYTLDGSDPKNGDGTVSPTALVYSGPITLAENTLLRARALANDEWSVYNEAQFFVGDALPAGAVAITEINYNPASPTTDELTADPNLDSDDFEFLEIHNTTDQEIDLTGAKFTQGVDFSFSAVDLSGQPMRLAPHEYAVLAGNRQAFAIRYGSDGIRVLGQYLGQLNNGGERIRLEGPLGATWLDFGYEDSADWPQRADGDGGTLRLLDPNGTDPQLYDHSSVWRGSTAFGGTPGAAGLDSMGVVINEVLTLTDQSPTDSIELFNASAVEVNIGGWFLSDSSNNFLKFQIPADASIGPGEFLVFDESDFNPNPTSPGPNSFALSGTRGDDVWLVTPDGAGGVSSFVDDVHFGAARSSESFGRTPNGTGRLAPMSSVTLGQANSDPRVGPVIVSELNYHPPDPSSAALAIDPSLDGNDLEFVEIYNPTAAPIDLTYWQIRGGVDFDFPPAMQLGAGQTVVVLSFNPESPDNAQRLAAFRAQYGIDASVPLVGGYQGSLSNGGELVQLRRPALSPSDEPIFIPYEVEDEVIYNDVAPWPAQADGLGGSLTRTTVDGWGNAASSWTSEVPSPGTTSFSVARPGDANQDGRFNQLDIVSVLQAGKYLTGQPASFSEGDWDKNGVFDQLDLVTALQAGDYQPGQFGVVGFGTKRKMDGRVDGELTNELEHTLDRLFARMGGLSI